MNLFSYIKSVRGGGGDSYLSKSYFDVHNQFHLAALINKACF